MNLEKIANKTEKMLDYTAIEQELIQMLDDNTEFSGKKLIKEMEKLTKELDPNFLNGLELKEIK